MAGYRIPPTAMLQKIAGETVILDLQSGNYFTLDEVGTRMLELLQELSEPDAVATALVREYDTDAGKIRTDLHELVKNLEKHSLLEIVD